VFTYIYVYATRERKYYYDFTRHYVYTMSIFSCPAGHAFIFTMFSSESFRLKPLPFRIGGNAQVGRRLESCSPPNPRVRIIPSFFHTDCRRPFRICYRLPCGPREAFRILRGSVRLDVQIHFGYLLDGLFSICVLRPCFENCYFGLPSG